MNSKPYATSTSASSSSSVSVSVTRETAPSKFSPIDTTCEASAGGGGATATTVSVQAATNDLDNLQITPMVYPSYNNNSSSTENKNCNGSANNHTLSSSEKAMNVLVNTMPSPPEVWSNGEVKVKHAQSVAASAGGVSNNSNGNPGTLAVNLTPQPIFSVGTKPLPSAGNSSPRLGPHHPAQGIIRSTSSGSLGSMGRHHHPGSIVRNGSNGSLVVTGLGGAVSSHTTNMRRQRRLERNRESARLSRRRRKQYLEVLEEKVATLSEMMDNGRRQHVAISVPTINALREKQFAMAEKDLIEHSTTSSKIPRMEGHLRILGGPFSRMSDELRIAIEFQREQLRCVCLPQHSKFIQWLTLQNDSYFRGGRSASERLSAARIGEKVSLKQR